MIVPDTLDTFDLPAEAPYTVDELHQDDWLSAYPKLVRALSQSDAHWPQMTAMAFALRIGCPPPP